MRTTTPRVSPTDNRNIHIPEIQRRSKRVALAAGVVLVALTASALMLSAILRDPRVGTLVIAAVILVPAVIVWLWQAPVRGVYVLMGASVLLPMYYRADLNDPISKYIPYFPDISMWTSIRIVVSINEIFITMLILIWILKGIATRNVTFKRGSLFLPLVLYMLVVLFGAAHGLVSGGDFRTILWEIRGQAYMFVSYILACNLIKSRREVQGLLWTLIIAAGIRGIEGSLRYIFIVHGKGAQELYSHEQSFFFNMFLTLVVLLFLYGGSQRMKRASMWLLPFVVYANLANDRRAAIAALAVCFLVLAVVTLVVQPERRRAIALILVVLAIVGPPYYVAFENQTGIIALPARAIASDFHPTARDAASDQYRTNEDADIMATMKVSPVFGYGFGKPMLLPYPLPDLTKVYVWWNVMPHNSILWVWMRIGIVGFFLLWWFIGSALVQGIALVRRLADRRLQGVALFVALCILQQVVIAYVDLQWSNWRCLIVTGILVGVIPRLARIQQAERAKGFERATLVRGRPRRVGERRVGEESATQRDAGVA